MILQLLFNLVSYITDMVTLEFLLPSLDTSDLENTLSSAHNRCAQLSSELNELSAQAPLSLEEASRAYVNTIEIFKEKSLISSDILKEVQAANENYFNEIFDKKLHDFRRSLYDVNAQLIHTTFESIGIAFDFSEDLLLTENTNQMHSMCQILRCNPAFYSVFSSDTNLLNELETLMASHPELANLSNQGTKITKDNFFAHASAGPLVNDLLQENLKITFDKEKEVIFEMLVKHIKKYTH